MNGARDQLHERKIKKMTCVLSRATETRISSSINCTYCTWCEITAVSLFPVTSGTKMHRPIIMPVAKRKMNPMKPVDERSTRWGRLRSRSWLFCSCCGTTLISRGWYFAALPASFVSVQQSLAFRHFRVRCLFSLVAILAHNAIQRVRFSLLLCTCNPGQHQNSAWLTSTVKK